MKIPKLDGEIMIKKIGKVKEVFIPEDETMDADKIGFKVMLDTEMIEIIEKQDERNSNIFKDDLVIITETNISNKNFKDIELYAGDLYDE